MINKLTEDMQLDNKNREQLNKIAFDNRMNSPLLQNILDGKACDTKHFNLIVSA